MSSHLYRYSDGQWHPLSSSSRVSTSTESGTNISGPLSPAQAVSSISTQSQSRVTQFIPPPIPSPSISPVPGSSRSLSIQRTAVSRNRRGRNQFPQGPTLGRAGILAPSPGLTVTIAIIPFKVGHSIKHSNVFSQALIASCITRRISDQ